jgi:putative peptidoglycan lipid II flippase
VFEHGRFTSADRDAVAVALLAFSVGLPAYVLNKALTPGFFGRHDTRTPVLASTVSVIVNLAVNVSLMHSIGHVGIAIGTSIAAWINAGILAVVLYRRGHLKPDARLKRRLPAMVAASAIMGAAVWWGCAALTQHIGPVFGAPGQAAGPNGLRTLALVALIAGGAAVYGASAFATGAATKDDLTLLRRKRS